MGKYAQNIMKSNNTKYLKKIILKIGKSAQNIMKSMLALFLLKNCISKQHIYYHRKCNPNKENLKDSIVVIW